VAYLTLRHSQKHGVHPVQAGGSTSLPESEAIAVAL
jgi:hypothetical protein